MKKVVMFVSIVIVICMVGCVTENKALGISNANDGIVARASTNPAGGGMNILPELFYAQNCFSYASSPFIVKDSNTTCARVFTMAKKKSFLGSLFGVDDAGLTMTYISSLNETPEQTVAIINAIKAASNVEATK